MDCVKRVIIIIIIIIIIIKQIDDTEEHITSTCPIWAKEKYIETL